jgi:Domain of unknown function (DUF4397)
MSRWLKAPLLTLALAALSLITTSCGSNRQPQVRFVNAIQNTNSYGGALDVEINGTKEFTNVQFATAAASTYTSVPSGSETIEGLENPADTTTIFTDTIDLKAGIQYTLIATGFAGGAGNNVLLLSDTDTNTAPAAGKVSFRVINASPSGPLGGGGPVDIYIVPIGSGGLTSSDRIISGLAYPNASTYQTVPYNSNFANGEWNYTLTVTLANNTTPVFSQNFAAGSSAAGTISTFVLTDAANVTEMNTHAIVLNDLN